MSAPTDDPVQETINRMLVKEGEVDPTAKEP